MEEKVTLSLVCPYCHSITTFNLYQQYGYYCSKCNYDFSQIAHSGSLITEANNRGDTTVQYPKFG